VLSDLLIRRKTGDTSARASERLWNGRRQKRRQNLRIVGVERNPDRGIGPATEIGSRIDLGTVSASGISLAHGGGGSRDRDRERSRGRDRSRDRDVRSKERDRDRPRGRSRDRERDRERDRDCEAHDARAETRAKSHDRDDERDERGRRRGRDGERRSGSGKDGGRAATAREVRGGMEVEEDLRALRTARTSSLTSYSPESSSPNASVSGRASAGNAHVGSRERREGGGEARLGGEDNSV